MSWKCLLAIGALALLFGGCKATRPTWWKFQGNAMNQGLAQEDGATPNERFRRSYGGQAFLGGPVLGWSDAAHKPRIVLGVGVNGVGRVVPLQGNLEVAFPTGGTVSTCPAVYESAEGISTIYCSTVDGVVYKLPSDLSNKEYWKKQLPAGAVLVTSPTPWGGLVLVGADKFLYALNDQDGTVAWSHTMPGQIVYDGAPAISIESGDDWVLITDSTGTVSKLRIRDGFLLWEVKIPGIQITGHLMVAARSLAFVPGSDGKMYVLDPDRGNVLWNFDTHVPGRLTGATQGFGGRTVYFANRTGTLFAIDVTTQAQAWSAVLPAPPTTPPVVTPNEMIYIGVGNGFPDAAVVAVNRDGVRWSLGGMRGLVNYLAVGEDGSVYAVAAGELIAIK